jgi:hypothetical protein
MTPTLDNVLSVLARLGADGKIMHVAHGWTRVFVTERSTGFQLGRIMFRFGEYQHPYWYGPSFERRVRDDAYLPDAWKCLVATGKVLSQEDWNGLRKEAERRAAARHAEKVTKRAELDRDHPLGSKWWEKGQRWVLKKRRRLDPPNVVSQMGEVVVEWIEANGGEPRGTNVAQAPDGLGR